MKPASIDIKDMIEAHSSFGLTYGTNLFVGSEPTLPNDCVTVFDSPSYPPDMTIEGDGDLRRAGVLVRVRNLKYEDGWDLANDILVFLHRKTNLQWGSATYILIKAVSSEPMYVERDGSNRAVFSVNFDIIRKRT